MHVDPTAPAASPAPAVAPPPTEGRARSPLRHVADALSAANAVCGGVSIVCAAYGRVDVSLLLLLLGAVFDGLDGAAARRFGGTRFGVLADDIADAVSYAVAPGVAIAHVVDGVAGTVVGVAFVVLTVTRLVYFTLRKGQPGDDPRHFRGMPSTVGGIVALAAAILFAAQPALVAFLAGMAVVLMVSFDAGFLHLGRAAGSMAPATRRAAGGAVVVVTGVAIALGPQVLATAALLCALTYAFGPHAQAFADAVVARARRAEEPVRAVRTSSRTATSALSRRPQVDVGA
jgi:CDP-diacylglycerol--serine O-phosphatidyltransferase